MKPCAKNAEGDCYRAAARLLLSLGGDARLVHGEVAGQGSLAGTRFGHAWVEINEMVLDVSNGRTICKERGAYYALGKIDAHAVRRYSMSEALRHMAREIHYGPWT